MVTVFGLGFVGLTTALGFAHMGYPVFGIEPNVQRREWIQSGKLPFEEPNMEDVLQETLGKTFFVMEDYKEAISRSKYCFYCVGTPYGAEGQADLTQIFTAMDSTLDQIKEIRDHLFRVLVVKSTVPPTTLKERILPYMESRNWKVGTEIGVVSNPEFLREGHCWDDFIHADRIVIGCEDERSEDLMRKLYAPMESPIVKVGYNTAEFIKYLSNTMLATMISYSNEMALMADVLGGIDVKAAFEAVHMDRRWNNGTMKDYIYPGCGYGGYCLPKDTNALYAQAKVKGFEAEILQRVIECNERMPEAIAKKMAKLMRKEEWMGVCGLSFKPFSDDVRETSSAKIIVALHEMGYHHIAVYDPIATAQFEQVYHLNVMYCDTLEQLRHQVQVVAIVTAWPEFQQLRDWTDKTIVDCRYMMEANPGQWNKPEEVIAYVEKRDVI